MADTKATTKKKKAAPKPLKIVETKRLQLSKAMGEPGYSPVMSRRVGSRRFNLEIGCYHWYLNAAELDLLIAYFTQAREEV